MCIRDSYWVNKLNIDPENIVWKRVVDLNDRALRKITINLEKLKTNIPRNDSFDITVASEVMAIFCLSNNIKDLEEKIGNITVAYTKDKKPVYAKDLNAHGPMTVLLKEAIRIPQVRDIFGIRAVDEIRNELNIS